MSPFRTQLVLEEQQRLFDVWQRAGAGRMPSRAEIQIRCFGALLPFVSLVECQADGSQAVRMAGSALQDVFGVNPYEALACRACPSAQPAMTHVAETGQPLAGTAATARPKGEAVRFWLRLPLGRDGLVEHVLGLDISMAARRAPQWALDQISASA